MAHMQLCSWDATLVLTCSMHHSTKLLNHLASSMKIWVHLRIAACSRWHHCRISVPPSTPCTPPLRHHSARKTPHPQLQEEAATNQLRCAIMVQCHGAAHCEMAYIHKHSTHCIHSSSPRHRLSTAVATHCLLSSVTLPT
jgi:hypothetical protein